MFSRSIYHRNIYKSFQIFNQSFIKRDIHAVIMGPPGGGKGTIAAKILHDFDFIHLSTGHILRHQVNIQSTLGKKAEEYMNNGQLVPDDLMIKLVVRELDVIGDEHNVLLDGFPRTIDQAASLDHEADIDLVLHLDVPIDIIVERISNRWVHEESGRVYSYDYNPPKVEGIDDVTGDPLIQRDDDKKEVVKERLLTYEQSTKPLVHYYTNRGVLAHFTGTKSDEIYVNVKKLLSTTLSTDYEPHPHA